MMRGRLASILRTSTALALGLVASQQAGAASRPQDDQRRPAVPAPEPAGTATPADAQRPAAATTDGGRPAHSGGSDAAAEEQRAADGTSGGDVVVTGSRTVTNGYSAPTPVTVLTSELLTNQQPQSLAQSLAQTPEFRNSASPQANSTGTSVGSSLGASYLNLRGLGSQRTLVLFDGHRITPTSFLGPSDIGVLPEGLISRVDIVTGGASAAYGSDAISGVVNFGLDTRFTGLKGVVQAGVSERGDNGNQKVVVTGGATLLDGRGHFVFNAEYYGNNGIANEYGRDWALRSYAIIAVPGVTDANKSPTNPKNVVVPNVRTANGNFGGLITNSALRGTQFLRGGVPAPFTFGSYLTTATMQGGDGVDAYYDLALQPDQRRVNVFGRFEYDLSDNVSAYVQGLYGRDRIIFVSGPATQLGSSQFTIFRDNAFLPTTIRDQLVARNIASFTLGRVSRDISLVRYNNLNQTAQFNAGLKGKLGNGWKFDLYYSHGENRDRSLITDAPIVTNLYRAADAVVSPATGQIVCRSTLTNPTDGCVPLNVFGEGSPSAAAIRYVTGNEYALQRFVEDYAGGSLAGDLFRLPGGPLSFAVGGEYRRDSARQTADALSTATVPTNTGINGLPATIAGKVGFYDRGNPQNFYGSTHVAEGFLELLAPVVKDLPAIHSLELNGAVRYADYKRSGGVTSYKGGVVYEPVDFLRLRATRSRDIRAPSLFEQYLAPSPASTGGPVTDPFNNNQVSPQITVIVAGNANLVPEKADTTSFGGVLRPAFIPGLGFSVDYWRINIRNAISQLFLSTPVSNAQLLINQCFAGNTALCGAIGRTNGVISSVNNTYFNINRFVASGVDFELTYRLPTEVAGTRLSFRGVASYLHELSSQLPGGLVIDRAGDNGQSAAGSPHWQGTASIQAENGPFSLFVQERYIGGGTLDNTFTASDININRVPEVWYTDLTLRLRVPTVSRSAEFFLTVNNLFDHDPPIDPRFANFGTVPTNRSLYDVVGRQFTSGIRFKF